jgi:CHAT domain-containing protein
MKASLVVLSACGAGRTHVLPGDEAMGFAAALIAMGVPNVVAPVTDVPDDDSWHIMADFHRYLAEGRSGPEALAVASPSLMARSFTWFGSEWRLQSLHNIDFA